MKVWFRKYILQFSRPVGTSRGVYTNRAIWLLFLEESSKIGIGECAPLPGLSLETDAMVEKTLKKMELKPELFLSNPLLLQDVPSVRFALETALLDLKNGGSRILFPSLFTNGTQGISINGLVWMGEPSYMRQQIHEKFKAGYSCIKLKIGALSFDEEIGILQSIRDEYSANEVTLRVDANGAFLPSGALAKLELLAKLNIHSIEQPIAAGNWDQMAEICRISPVPVALDEELIGIHSLSQKRELLNTVQPQYLVLKPSLHGGLSGCDEWISLANQFGIGWWITSYLESNIGLNAIAQWTFTKKVTMHQGLGTGQLFTNNFSSPLEILGEQLWYNPAKNLEIPFNL